MSEPTRNLVENSIKSCFQSVDGLIEIKGENLKGPKWLFDIKERSANKLECFRSNPRNLAGC